MSDLQQGSSDRKLLSFSQVVVPLLIFIIGLFVASSYLGNTADIYIGDPIARIGQVPMFSPEVYIYVIRYLIEYQTFETFDSYLLNSIYIMIGFIITAALLRYFLSVLRGSNENKGIYGKARMGTENDLESKGFLKSEKGIVLGQLADAHISIDENGNMNLKKPSAIIADSGDTSVLVIAPSRSGKGVSTVIPTLLSHPGSVIVFDPKGENWNTTAGFRQTFSHVLRFSPVNAFSIKFNPLAEIRRDENAYRDASTIADILSESESKASGGNSEHFTITAKDLLCGAILHVAFASDIADEDRHLGKVLDVLSGVDVGPGNGEEDPTSLLLKKIIATPHENADVHRQVVSIMCRALSKADRERASVFSTATSKLMLLEDPILRRNMSTSELKITDFYDCANPISLYLTIPYSDIGRLAPIIRLVITFMIRRFTEGETQFGEQNIKFPLLFLIDEFPTLGRFKFLETTLGIIAGYNCRFLIIVQSLQQIIDTYGQNHPFLEHCKTWIAFAPGDLKSAKELSEIIGKTSIYKESQSSSGSKQDIGMKNISVSGSEVQVNVMNPDEIMQLPQDQILVFAHGMAPYKGKKVLFYMDKRFIPHINWKKPETREELFEELPFRHVEFSEQSNEAQKQVVNVINNVSLEEALASDEGEALTSVESSAPAESMGRIAL